MAKEKKSKKEKTKKEEVEEIFEVEKKGEEKVIEKHGKEEVKISEKGQIVHQKKLLRNILIVLGVFVGIFILAFFLFSSWNYFEYKGIKFNTIEEQDVTFFHTSFPTRFLTPATEVAYHVYLRNDPRELDNIPFDGTMSLRRMAIIESDEDFVCDGDGVIAIANFNQIMRAAGIDVFKDPEAKCDPEGRYMFINIKPGTETKIEQTGPICYNLMVNNCEILEVTEKFLVEALAMRE